MSRNRRGEVYLVALDKLGGTATAAEIACYVFGCDHKARHIGCLLAELRRKGLVRYRRDHNQPAIWTLERRAIT